ncbi:MAG: hypothetical protein GY797_09910, partial [Deltaproteobacteria bacterium]|nr:hypothetical protein [Deltaproteobacteria bacterium]
DPLTTAAAIDRVVHHSRIIEFGSDMTSVRAEQAARQQQKEEKQQQQKELEQQKEPGQDRPTPVLEKQI